MAKVEEHKSNIENISPIKVDELDNMNIEQAREAIKNFLIHIFKLEDFIKKDNIEKGEVKATNDYLRISLKN